MTHRDAGAIRRSAIVVLAIACTWVLAGCTQARPHSAPAPAPGPISRGGPTRPNRTTAAHLSSAAVPSPATPAPDTTAPRPLGVTPGHVTGSRLLRVNIPGPSAGIDSLGAYVYLPAGYDDSANASVRYPVVYLLHGTPGWPSDWFQPAAIGSAMDRLVASAAVRPMILVAATSNRHHLDDSECLNAVHGPQMETYLTRDVPAYVDAHWRTLADRGHRAIAGISSGGYCALNLAMRHQGDFSVVLAQMPYGDPGPAREVTHRLLGDQPALYRANSPSLYLPGFVFTNPIAFFLDAGARDSEVLNGAKKLKSLLASDGESVQLRVVPRARHSWAMARGEQPFALLFASRAMQP